VLIDLDRRTTFAYVMNRMTPAIIGDGRAYRILKAFWAALGARG
jgi:hypothetical protein